MKKKRTTDKKVFQSLTLITQFSINMLVPIGLMTWLGIFLDRKLDTSYWVIILFFVGAIAGFQNVFRMARGIFGDKKSRDTKEEGKKKEDS